MTFYCFVKLSSKSAIILYNIKYSMRDLIFDHNYLCDPQSCDMGHEV